MDGAMTRLKRILGSVALLAACVSFAKAQEVSPSASQKPAIVGIAHVAIQVADLEKSSAFYQKLGFAQPFEITKDGKVAEAFIKLNDRQYLELYPVEEGKSPSFQHVCWEAVNLSGLYPIYTANGVVSKPVRKAGAGNMLMAWKGPEGQTEEITEYLPGSKHSQDFGQHLSADRIATHLIAAVVPMSDPTVAAQYFTQKMGFVDGGIREGARVVSPPRMKSTSVGFLPADSPVKLALVFDGVKVGDTLNRLKTLGIAAETEKQRVVIHDPDGNLLVFTAR